MRPLSLLLLTLLTTVRANAADVAWQPTVTIPGVFDIGGPRTDGSLVVAGSGRLYLVSPGGQVQAFAAGPGGYADDAGAEAYLTVSPGVHVRRGGCDFLPNEVFVLRIHAPMGITRVSQAGQASSFVNLGLQSLTGITFDTTGSFGFRLLASGTVNGKTVIAAIDCNATVQFITRNAPALEGGIAVAPTTFGPFGGALIAPDELSGNIYAIAPDGSVAVVAKSGLATGGDIGVEGVGFVPTGFGGGGHVYFSDRGTPNNPHPGTDHLLRLSAADVMAAGVQEGDLLAATEGGGSMIAVHCAAACALSTVVGTATTAHGEGHIGFTLEPAAAQASASPQPVSIATSSRTAAREAGLPVAGALIAVALVALGAAFLVVRRRRRR
jgi:hypothetical protein